MNANTTTHDRDAHSASSEALHENRPATDGGQELDAEDGDAAAVEDADAAASDATDADDETVETERATAESTQQVPGQDADLLIPVDEYLQSGVHIGTQQKTQEMEPFIHRTRDDGLYVLDIALTDDRIRTAAQFLANYEPEHVLVASSRQYGRYPAEQFAEAVGARVRTGRFIPGTLTNPDYEGYIEPDVVVVTDPIGDAQAVAEAVTVGIPVIAMCDSNNSIADVDLVIPTNNKGRRALAVVYWLLANETLDARGAEPRFALDDFQEL